MKISALPAANSFFNSGSLVPVVVDPSGTPTTQRGTVAGLMNAMGIFTCKKTSDQTFNSTTPVDVTQLSFPVSASHYYKFEFFVLVRSEVSATTGVAVAVTTPAFIRFGATARAIIAADGTGAEFQGAMTTSGDAVIPTAVPAINTDYLHIVEGVLLPSANGTLQMQARTETGTLQVNVRQGSIGILWDLGTT